MTAAAANANATSERLADQLEKIIEKRIEEDNLVLPALPAVAAKCLEILKSPDFSIKEAAALIEKDPILAVQVIKLVNSAALGTREPIKKVQDAITRLGVQKLKGFLVEAAARKVFDSKDGRIAATNRIIWEHSVVTAAVSADVAALANAGDPQTAHMAGLLHDIGKPIVASMLLEAERSITMTRPGASWIGSTDWVKVVQRIHRKLGLKLAQKWEIPEQVIKAIRDCEEYDNGDRLSAANAVRLANALVKANGIYEGDVNKDDIQALVMIGQSMLGVDANACRQLVTTAKNSVKNAL